MSLLIYVAQITSLDDVKLSERIQSLIPGSIGEEAAKLIRELKISGAVFMDLSEDELDV